MNLLKSKLEYLTKKKFSNIHPEFIYDLIIKKDNKEYEDLIEKAINKYIGASEMPVIFFEDK